MSQLAPNPYDPPRASWVAPIVLGVLATVLLHSPLLLGDVLWILVCCTCGCSGALAGAVPALVALRRDPYLGAASGFAVAFIAVGIGGIVLAVIAASSWELDPTFLEEMRARMQEQGYAEEEADRAVEGLQEVSPYVPVVAAGLMALMGGAAGALAAATVGRRPPASWPPATPGSPPPPA